MGQCAGDAVSKWTCLALPQSCAIKLRDPHTGKRKVIYAGRCLKQQGYRLAHAN